MGIDQLSIAVLSSQQSCTSNVDIALPQQKLSGLTDVGLCPNVPSPTPRWITVNYCPRDVGETGVQRWTETHELSVTSLLELQRSIDESCTRALLHIDPDSGTTDVSDVFVQYRTFRSQSDGLPNGSSMGKSFTAVVYPYGQRSFKPTLALVMENDAVLDLHFSLAKLLGGAKEGREDSQDISRYDIGDFPFDDGLDTEEVLSFVPQDHEVHALMTDIVACKTICVLLRSWMLSHHTEEMGDDLDREVERILHLLKQGHNMRLFFGKVRIFTALREFGLCHDVVLQLVQWLYVWFDTKRTGTSVVSTPASSTGLAKEGGGTSQSLKNTPVVAFDSKNLPVEKQSRLRKRPFFSPYLHLASAPSTRVTR